MFLGSARHGPAILLETARVLDQAYLVYSGHWDARLLNGQFLHRFANQRRSMKTIRQVIASITVIAYSFAFVGCTSVSGGGSAEAKRPVPVSEVIAKLAGKQMSELSMNEAADLALAKLVKGDVAGARASAKQGAEIAQIPRQKAAFYALVAKTYGMEGYYRDAANTALKGQQIDPTSVELAACRYEYFSQLPGEGAQTRSAENQLRSLDPNFKRQVVMDPATAIVILVTVKILIDKVVIPLLVKSESVRATQWLEVAQTASTLLGVVGVGASIILGVSVKYP